jgi:transcriptional regulator with XRE-family HTH domain
MILFRRLLGDVLRRHRQAQGRTLRDVAAAARISLGYLSEVERGQKEASSELLASLCAALDISLADVLREVGDELARAERAVSASSFGFNGKVAVRTPSSSPLASVSSSATKVVISAPEKTTNVTLDDVVVAPVAMLSASRSDLVSFPVVAA